MIRPCLAVTLVAPLSFMLGAPIDAQERLRVGFIYIGPVGAYGWTYAHDQGRK
jgi:basic membrane protein A and related proteins